MNDGGSAFPTIDVRSTHDDDGRGDMNGIETITEEGMSLRDYFAGQAFPVCFEWASRSGAFQPWNAAAIDAYRCADAMLEERAK